ncbi:MAG: AI-2E family transporter [Armatimonadetes bacterium]|nr:AI-2E family transporter [Armatimonadota bacterium]
MLVATFNPWVRRLQQRVNRRWAITMVVSLLLTAAALLAAVMIPVLVRQAHQLAANLPTYLASAEDGARSAGIPFKLQAFSQQWTDRVTPVLVDYSLWFFNGVVGATTIFVLTIYLLIEGPQVAANLLLILPRPERLPVHRAVTEIGGQVGAYMRGQFLMAGWAGLFSFIVLYIWASRSRRYWEP